MFRWWRRVTRRSSGTPCNPCDTLEACRELGLETREVCRALYEKPVQFLISQLDPELRFVRNYHHIRPEASECEEGIVRVSFQALMTVALDEARRSLEEGNKGYGAVVARGQEILASAHDTVSTDGDPSCHAEVNAIRAAVAVLGESNLSGWVLVSTCEPCPMCSSLAVWANLTTIVYGASIAETAAMGRARIRISAADVVAASPATVEVIGGVCRDECLALYGRD